MANVLLLCDELPLVWEWLKANPDANAWDRDWETTELVSAERELPRE